MVPPPIHCRRLDAGSSTSPKYSTRRPLPLPLARPSTACGQLSRNEWLRPSACRLRSGPSATLQRQEEQQETQYEQSPARHTPKRSKESGKIGGHGA